jgi:nucleoside-diphosphate-sugar epimerase
MNILILGATGFLGKYLVKEFSEVASKIYVVTRNDNSNLFKQYSNVELVSGDITDLEIIKDSAKKNEILCECDLVIHAAALYDLKAEYADLYLHNVVGTQNVLNFIKKTSRLKLFYYISTIAIADEQSEFIDENSLPERTDFADFYSKTKYLAEKSVREFAKGKPSLPMRIIRPGAIVGDSITGEIGTINGPYYFLEVIKKFKHLLKNIPIFPLSYNPNTELQFIPVDHVAHYIFLLITREQYARELKTYHLICIDPPKIEDFMKDISRELGIKTRFYPMASNKVFNFLVLPYLNIPKEIIPFMFSKISYDKTLTLKDLPELKDSKYADFKKIFF